MPFNYTKPKTGLLKFDKNEEYWKWIQMLAEMKDQYAKPRQ